MGTQVIVTGYPVPKMGKAANHHYEQLWLQMM